MSKSKTSSGSVESAVEYLTTKEGFDCTEVIGKGSYGSVVKISKRNTGQMAAKVVEYSVVNQLEIDEWPSLKHDHVLQLVQTFKGLSGVVIFVTDLMETNLFQRLHSKDFRNGRESPDRCRLYARQVLSGMAYLHGQNLCHLDLRAENVLIAFDDRAVVADFSGLCKSVDMKRFCPLPSSLRPPEMLTTKKMRVKPMAVDLWAYGLLVIHMYIGKGFQDSTVKTKNSGTIEACLLYMSYFSCQSYMEKFFHETYPNSEVSVVRIKELIGFIELFLQMGPENRTKAEDALGSGFLNAPFYRTAEPSSSRLATVALMIHNQGHNNEEPDSASDEETDVNEGACGEDLAVGATKKKTHWFRIGRIKVHKPSKFFFRSDKTKTDKKPDKKKKHTKFFI